MENSMEAPQITKNRTKIEPHDPGVQLLGIYPKECKSK
jgi:hypothetical protein